MFYRSETSITDDTGETIVSIAPDKLVSEAGRSILAGAARTLARMGYDVVDQRHPVCECCKINPPATPTGKLCSTCVGLRRRQMNSQHANMLGWSGG